MPPIPLRALHKRNLPTWGKILPSPSTMAFFRIPMISAQRLPKIQIPNAFETKQPYSTKSCTPPYYSEGVLAATWEIERRIASGRRKDIPISAGPAGERDAKTKNIHTIPQLARHGRQISFFRASRDHPTIATDIAAKSYYQHQSKAKEEPETSRWSPLIRDSPLRMIGRDEKSTSIPPSEAGNSQAASTSTRASTKAPDPKQYPAKLHPPLTTTSISTTLSAIKQAAKKLLPTPEQLAWTLIFILAAYHIWDQGTNGSPEQISEEISFCHLCSHWVVSTS